MPPSKTTLSCPFIVVLPAVLSITISSKEVKSIVSSAVMVVAKAEVKVIFAVVLVIFTSSAELVIFVAPVESVVIVPATAVISTFP